MKQKVRVVMSSIIMSGCLSGLATEGPDVYRSPLVFEDDIRQFEISDLESPPPAGAIVCTGSSSMRGWHSTIREDLAPLDIIPRGFGGSNMNDLLHYVDRIVIPYRPRAVVVYEGDNDIGQGVPPELIILTARKLVRAIHAELPDCRLYFLSVKPSIKRWGLWPQMQEVNRAIHAMCEEDYRLTFVDIATPMLGPDGQYREDLYVEDDLHMTEEGYRIWKKILRPILMAGELDR